LFVFIISLPGISSSFECVNTKFAFDIKGDIDQPSDVTVGPRGNIYFVDGVNNRIVVVDKKGRFKFTFGKKGSGNGEFDIPLGIDISPEGVIYVADTGNRRIQAFDPEGNFAGMFSTDIESDRHPSEPVDVLVSGFRNRLFVVDNNNHNVKVYNDKEGFEFEFGGFGEEFGEFRYPATIADNSAHEVFVVDVLNTRVQKFSPDGEHITDIGSWGVHPGDLFRPKGVAVSDDDWVFVSDSYMGVVQVFSDMGQLDGVVCEKNEKRVFETPVGVFVDKDHRLLVVEMKGNKITVLKIVK
jgi:DNA-binding beta-propeller fold protein YncE